MPHAQPKTFAERPLRRGMRATWCILGALLLAIALVYMPWAQVGQGMARGGAGMANGFSSMAHSVSQAEAPALAWRGVKAWMAWSWGNVTGTIAGAWYTFLNLMGWDLRVTAVVLIALPLAVGCLVFKGLLSERQKDALTWASLVLIPAWLVAVPWTIHQSSSSLLNEQASRSQRVSLYQGAMVGAGWVPAAQSPRARKNWTAGTQVTRARFGRDGCMFLVNAMPKDSVYRLSVNGHPASPDACRLIGSNTLAWSPIVLGRASRNQDIEETLVLLNKMRARKP